jgi:hypothetical protein
MFLRVKNRSYGLFIIFVLSLVLVGCARESHPIKSQVDTIYNEIRTTDTVLYENTEIYDYINELQKTIDSLKGVHNIDTLIVTKNNYMTIFVNKKEYMKSPVLTRVVTQCNWFLYGIFMIVSFCLLCGLVWMSVKIIKLKDYAARLWQRKRNR